MEWKNYGVKTALKTKYSIKMFYCAYLGLAIVCVKWKILHSRKDLTRWWWRQSVPNVPFELNDIEIFFPSLLLLVLLFHETGCSITMNGKNWTWIVGRLFHFISSWASYNRVQMKTTINGVQPFQVGKMSAKKLPLVCQRMENCFVQQQKINNWTTTATSTKCMAIATDTYIYTSNTKIDV